MSDYIYTTDGELYHYGVPGMKWGVRKSDKKSSYRSTSIKSAIARRANEKIDAGFKKWGENAKKKSNAVELGKKANITKLAYEKDRTNKELKSAYKDTNKQYKKALSSNTTYRKGAIKKEVGQDLSRKYLSEAKKVKKQLDNNPSDKALKKQYNDLMSKHDVERARARRAADVGAKRSSRIAAIKRGMTMTAKAAATTAAIGVGAYAVNRYLNNHNVTRNGQRVNISAKNIRDVLDIAKKAKDFMGYIY